MTSQTQKDIIQLYQVFSKYKLNPNMEASPLYSLEKVKKWNEQVSIKDSKELNGNELSLIAFKGGYTWGTINDYKHFLPRILELIALYNEELIEIFVVFNKFNQFEWLKWRKDEITAVLNFLNSLWIQLLEDKERASFFEERIAGIFEVHPSPLFLLNTWQEINSKSSILKFIYFIRWNEDGIKRNKIESFDFAKKDPKILSSLFLNWAKNEMAIKLKKNLDETTDQKLFDSLFSIISLLKK